jgi:tetratricopeptide (TPR) repeat protein
MGLGSLRFTIDPKLFQEGYGSAGPMASRFLKIHGKALAKELQVRPEEGTEKRAASRSRRSSDPLRMVAATAQDLVRRRVLLVLAAVTGLVIFGAAAWIAYTYSTDPLKAQISFENGQRQLMLNHYTQAIPFFDRTIRLEPGFADAYFFRGKALAASGDREGAIQDFSQAILLQPVNPGPLLERGGTYLYLKNYRGAVADATRAIEIDPTIAPAYNLRAMAIREMGDPHKALADLDRAVQLNPSQENFFERASTYQLVGDHRKAIEDLTRLIENEPGDVPAYYARAQSRRAIGDTAGADSDSQHARELEHR